MTEQATGASEPEGKLTHYVVEVEHDAMDDSGLVLWTGWWRVAMLGVPRRTQTVTVLQRAGELVEQFAKNHPGDVVLPVRFRVLPDGVAVEGRAEMETPPAPEPRLVVTAL
jgi:hypothetical protein